MFTQTAETYAVPPAPRATSMPASRLRWQQATAEQLAFMRSVYEHHVRRSAASRPFLPDVPPAELDWVNRDRQQGERLRREAAAALRRLLAEARAALARERSRGTAQARAVTQLGISSGYRSASQQFSLWERRFPGYYQETATARARLPGGAHGAQAAEFLSRHIGRWLAAPGFSNHNHGLAADLFTVEDGKTFTASRKQAAIWRTTWFFGWLSANAARFGFRLNPSINEPWHWEFSPRASGKPAAATPAGSWAAPSAPSRGKSAAMPAGGRGGPAVTGQAAPVVSAAGRAELARLPLLDRAGGTPPAAVLRWNAMPASPTVVDVVLHFHGYARCGHPAPLLLPRDVEPISGLDFANPERGASSGPQRMRPTLAILPRGTLTGPATQGQYVFPSLMTPAGLKELLEVALDQFGRQVRAARPRVGRLILTAHSGGGAALLRALSFVNPHEVHIFDALYGWPAEDYAALTRWVQARIRADQSALARVSGTQAESYMRTQGGALRCVFGPTTCRHSHALHATVSQALAAAPVPQLAAWYRVERTLVQHCAIPPRYGWRLLADARANLPDITSPGTCH